MLTAQEFRNEIETFLAKTGMSATAFGRAAVNDPNFVGDLANGRTPSLRLVERISKFMDASTQEVAR